MSGPSLSNIDRWFFEYVEGNLSPEQEAQLEAFILNHPDLELELDAWKSATIEPTIYEFPNQETLFQSDKKRRRFIPFYWTTAGVFCISLSLLLLLPTEQSNTGILFSSQAKTSHLNNRNLGQQIKTNLAFKKENRLIDNNYSTNSSRITNQSASIEDYLLSNDQFSKKSPTLLNSDSNQSFLADQSSPNDLVTNETASSNKQMDTTSTLSDNLPLENKLNQNKLTHNSKNTKKSNSSESTILSGLEKSVGKLNEFMEKSLGLKNTRDHQVHLPGVSQIDANFSSAGDVSSTRFRALNRAQWMNKENQQLSTNFSLDWYSKSIRSGFAIQGKYAYYSNGVIQDWNTAIVYSPKLALSRSFLIEPAIRFKMGNKLLDGDKVISNSQVEIDRNNSLDFYPDGSAPIGKLLWYKDIGASLLLHSKWFYTGFQLDNLLHHQDNIYSNNLDNPKRTSTHLTLYAGTDYESKSGDFAFAPYVLYDQLESRKETWGGFNIQYRAFAMGGAYSSKNNLALSLGIRLTKIALTYQFDQTYSQLLGRQAISHQIGITLNSKVSRSPRRYISLK